MRDEHDLILLESDLEEIVRAVEKDKEIKNICYKYGTECKHDCKGLCKESV